MPYGNDLPEGKADTSLVSNAIGEKPPDPATPPGLTHGAHVQRGTISGPQTRASKPQSFGGSKQSHLPLVLKILPSAPSVGSSLCPHNANTGERGDSLHLSCLVGWFHGILSWAQGLLRPAWEEMGRVLGEDGDVGRWGAAELDPTEPGRAVSPVTSTPPMSLGLGCFSKSSDSGHTPLSSQLSVRKRRRALGEDRRCVHTRGAVYGTPPRDSATRLTSLTATVPSSGPCRGQLRFNSQMLHHVSGVTCVSIPEIL